MDPTNHFTTRRGFIAASGFGGISLYGLWAAYGAAPGPLALLGLDGHLQSSPASAGEHAGHSAAAAPQAPAEGAGSHTGHGAAAQGPASEEFSRQTQAFAERYRMPDGSVYPRHLAAASMDATDPHAGHAMPAEPDPHASHGASTAHASAPTDEHAGHGDNDMPVNKDQPIDVLVTAGRWYYLPDKLRLDAGQAYRFKMMAVDIAHGASLQLGQGGRMMRLQPGRITEAALTFHQPGRYLMLCTVYCGEAHQLMQATIEVV